MAKIVKGYPKSMPSFAGQVDDDQMDAILAFMKTLK
jgi:mono/diheme cytochrome c family protein